MRRPLASRLVAVGIENGNEFREPTRTTRPQRMLSKDVGGPKTLNPFDAIG